MLFRNRQANIWVNKMSEISESSEAYYEKDIYEGGITQTLNFNQELYDKIKNDFSEIPIKKIFKTKWYERNKEVRYIAQKHENHIDITALKGKAKINLITEDIIKRELKKVPSKSRENYRNIYFGAIEFTIKAYFQNKVNTPLELYLRDERILSNLEDSIIAVLKGNLIYQKVKFTVHPDFSISMEDGHKDLALTLYFKLHRIDMPKDCKVMSIETKIVYALTGKHHVKKYNDENIIIPKLYSDVLEPLEYKKDTRITLPEEMYIDFENKKTQITRKMMPIIEGSRLSFKHMPETSLQSDIPRNLDLINLIINEDIKIKGIIFNRIMASEIIITISPGNLKSLINKNMINEDDCEIITPQICNYPKENRNIVITKAINLKFMIQDLEYNIKLGVLEYDSIYELLLGTDFLNTINYKITNEGIEIRDQNKERYIKKI